jgi:hypothetical protein
MENTSDVGSKNIPLFLFWNEMLTFILAKPTDCLKNTLRKIDRSNNLESIVFFARSYYLERNGPEPKFSWHSAKSAIASMIGRAEKVFEAGFWLRRRMLGSEW